MSIIENPELMEALDLDPGSIRHIATRSSDDLPEIALMRAALIGAWRDLGSKDQKILYEAKRWFLSDEEGFFTFVDVCEYLGYCPTRIRKRLGLI